MKRKTRMYEPWGYQEENNYQGGETILDNDLESFFADTSYNKDDNKIYFTNKDGEVKASLDVNEFVKSDSIIDHTEYKDGILKIYFTNGDVVTIDLTELVDENEFKDGLIVDGHIVKVLINSESDDYISVDGNGVKLAGVKADIEAEEARATSAETALDEKIDAEIARATDVETQLQASIEAEGQRAQDAESALNTAISNEVTRAEAAEAALSRRNDMLNDELDGEKTIREAEDVKLDRKIDKEIDDRIADVDEEEARAKAAEEALQGAIDDEVSRAYSAESELAEGIEILGSVKFDGAEYDSSAKTINFYAEGNVVATIDASDFIKDGMIDNVEIKDGNLVITFNTESGKQPISIPLTDIFNPDNYYNKTEVDAFVSALTASDEAISNAVDNVSAEVENEAQRALSAETDLQTAIELKADKETTYTKEEVDALIAEKEAEIVQIKKDYNSLKEIVGELGGNVEWGVPADGTFNNMMKKSGTVKLGEDTTTSTYTGGITSKNKTTLHLNGKNLTFSGSTTNNPGIMTRGEQELTIMGKGTFDAAGRIAVEANGADTVINLSGTTGFFAAEPTYVTDRSGGELIYCYLGTINISAGVFKNNGDDKTFLLNCYDANYTAGTAKIVVTGGKFYDFDPSNAMSEPGAPVSYLAPGYHVETSTVVEEGVEHTVYTVKAD